MESYEYLGELKLPNNKSLPCINGWRISIKSLLLLWSDLRSSQTFEYLLTNRLNQDCLENLFSIIRGKGGKRDNPDAREFRSAYRQVVFDQILLPSHGSNCELDRDGIFLSLTNFNMSNDVKITLSGHSVESAFPDIDSVMKMTAPISLPLQNVEAYMAGYLIRKSKISQCSNCKFILEHYEAPNTPLYVFLQEKAYREHGTLVYPKERFVSLVEQWEKIFQTSIDHVIHMNGVLGRLVRYAMATCDQFLACDNDTCKYKLTAMLKLYMKVRLHAALKRLNKEIGKSTSGKRNRKLLKLQHL